METAKYKVTTVVGHWVRDNIIDVKVLLSSDGDYLVLHPEEEGYSACLEICARGSDGYLFSKNGEAYINLPRDWKENLIKELGLD